MQHFITGFTFLGSYSETTKSGRIEEREYYVTFNSVRLIVRIFEIVMDSLYKNLKNIESARGRHSRL